MAIIGHTGSVTVAGTAAATAKIWSLDITGDTQDTTTFASSGWKTNAATLRGWSGSITVIYDGGDTQEAALITSLTTGVEVAFVFLTGATGSGTAESFTGSGLVNSMPLTQDVNGIVEVSFSFVGSGALVPSAVA